jgi:histidinol-phosphate aminotransferase
MISWYPLLRMCSICGVWQVLEALGSMQFPNIYPDPESRRLRAALAEDTGLGAEHILVGCGADELIDLIDSATLLLCFL